MAQRYIIGTDDPDRATLYASPLSTGRISLAGQVRNDKVLALTIEPMVLNTTGATPVLLPDFEVTDTFQVAIGLADQAPSAGTFKLTVAGSTTNLTALAYNVTAAALQTPFNVAMVAGGFSAATITLIGEGTYRIIGNSVGAIPAATVVPDKTNLVPTCDAFVSELDLGSVSAPYRLLLVIRQSAVALAAPATLLPTTGLAVAVTQALSSTTNAINSISFTGANPISGTFLITAYALGVTRTIGAAAFNISPTDLTTLLETHPKLTNNVTVVPSGTGYLVEFNNSAGPKQITGSTLANPTVITTSIAHGYTNGQTVTHSGTNSTPVTDGAQVVTVISDTTYSVPVNVTVAGTTGTSIDSTAPILSVANIDVLGPKGVSGTINLNTENLWEYSLSEVDSTAEFWDMYFTITRTRASGEVRTIYGPATIQLAKDIVDAASLVPVPLPSYYTSIQSDARFAQLGAANVFSSGFSQTFSGTVNINPAARTSGSASYLSVNMPADTTLTAGTESIGALFAGSTRQFSTGAIALQRERVFAAPTYGFVGATVVTSAVNADFADPVAGTNASLTNKHAIRAASIYCSGKIDLGNISDTSIARLSAGVVTIEGVTIGTESNTLTLTNKRVTPRVTSIVSNATPTVNTDNTDLVTITAQAVAITSMTSNLSGTPTDGDRLTVRIKDDGTARAITYGALFVAEGAALRTTTTLGKVGHDFFIWDAVKGKWGCISSITEA